MKRCGSRAARLQSWFEGQFAGGLSMPLYAYECENCGARFDRRQGFDDEPIRVCPECKKRAVHRLIQPAGVIRVLQHRPQRLVVRFEII
jgi:putative FmdB family regulatory protein